MILRGLTPKRELVPVEHWICAGQEIPADLTCVERIDHVTAGETAVLWSVFPLAIITVG